jgi:ribosomal protein L24
MSGAGAAAAAAGGRMRGIAAPRPRGFRWAAAILRQRHWKKPAPLGRWVFRMGDRVMVRRGDSTGHIGAITAVDREAGRVAVEGAKLARVRVRSQGDDNGTTKFVPKLIHVSKIVMIDPALK